MKAKNLCVYAGLCAGVASMAAGQNAKPQELVAGVPQRVQPNQVRHVAMQDGKLVYLSDWMDYTGRTDRATNVRIFDCFGDEGSDGVPDTGGAACGIGEASRWYFGTTYCNMFYSNDMTVVSDTVIADGASEADFVWYWNPNGDGTAGSQTCVIAVFTEESTPCDADTFDYSGWLLDFGTLPTGGWFSDVFITTGAWTLPSTGTGSYLTFFLSEVTTSGGFILANCAHPFAWGTGEDGGAPDMVGSQGTNQFDDDVDFNGSHSSSECYTYSFGVCPDPLGAMMQFWGNRGGGDPCLDSIFPNCNGDGAVNTQDFLCFLGKWSAAFSSGNYDAAADCNVDGVINTQDFLCFLQKFSACFG